MERRGSRTRGIGKPRLLLAVSFGIVAAGLGLTGSVGTPVDARGAQAATAAALDRAPAQRTPAQTERCPGGQVHVPGADVGIEGVDGCLPVAAGSGTETRVNDLYGRIAAEVIAHAGTRARGLENRQPLVVCWGRADWEPLQVRFRASGVDFGLNDPYGWVAPSRRVINLSPQVCGRLDRIAYGDDRPDHWAFATAVSTLAHEAMHVAGIWDEGIADCYALQLTVLTALGLGAEPEYAEALRVHNFEFHGEYAGGSAYDSPDCYEGGPLDLDLDDPSWP